MRRYDRLTISGKETDGRHSIFLIRLNVDISPMYFQVVKALGMSRN